MLVGNQTSINYFFLMGFPGLDPSYYGLVSAVLFLVYISTLFGNAIFLLLFITDQNLQKPMYFIILNLVVSDVLFSTTTLPKIIARYWFQAGTISFTACFVQMYFVHYFGAVNTFVLLMMAIDRYVAICHPLRYSTIITNSTIFTLSIISWVIAIGGPLMNAIRAFPLPYCADNVIVQCYCDYISIISLACTDRTPYISPSLFFSLVMLLMPLTFIMLSYLCIVVVVLQITSTQGRLKTLSTCSTQLIIITLYYVPRCFVYLASNVGLVFSTDLRITIIMFYSLLPPMVNPLIYSLRAKEVKDSLIKWLKKQRVDIQKANISVISK
nr:olfactory receptor 2AT4-like [Paramormyrops kingsleyae]